jgi:hypothetical protein
MLSRYQYHIKQATLAKQRAADTVALMNPWTSQNNPGKQALWALVCTVLGGLLLFAGRHVSAGGSNTKAAFALGLLLAVVGVWG